MALSELSRALEAYSKISTKGTDYFVIFLQVSQLILAQRNIAGQEGNASFHQMEPWPFVSAYGNAPEGIDPFARAMGRSMLITVSCTEQLAVLNHR